MREPQPSCNIYIYFRARGRAYQWFHLENVLSFVLSFFSEECLKNLRYLCLKFLSEVCARLNRQLSEVLS
jgi:hypothetical protein